jgi:hypothetical protein
VIQLSATSGAGMDEWLAFLHEGVARANIDRHPAEPPSV